MFSLRLPTFLAFALLGSLCFLLSSHAHPLSLSIARRGKDIQLTIKSKEYTLKPLGSHEQGENSEAYRIDGGWQGKEDQPAIVKMPRSFHEANFKKERKYLDKMDQLYTYSDAKAKPYLVMKDVHTNFPKKGSPPLAPLYEILDKHSDMDVEESTTKIMKLSITTAESIAEKEKLVYRDIQPLNVFTNKELTVVVFIDWDPASVVDVSTKLIGGDSKETVAKRKEAALAMMRKNAKNNFTAEKVRAKMGGGGSEAGPSGTHGHDTEDVEDTHNTEDIGESRDKDA